MTREQIELLDGRDLDAAVAMQLGGYVWLNGVEDDGEPYSILYPEELAGTWCAKFSATERSETPRGGATPIVASLVPAFSVDTAAAMRLLDQFRSVQIRRHERPGEGETFIDINTEDDFPVDWVTVAAPTFALAACRAFLLTRITVSP
jgi:hypothetical protein